MARGPTVAELLAYGKKRAKRIRRKAVRDVEALIPPILGPAGRVAPSIANLAGIATETLINEVADRAFRDFQGLEVPLVPQQRIRESEALAEVTAVRTPRVRSDKQIVNDQIQSIALKSINKRARKKDGTLKKGWTQKKIMRLAQLECTRERERLGLCHRKSTRKGQIRKTARRGYEGILPRQRRTK